MKSLFALLALLAAVAAIARANANHPLLGDRLAKVTLEDIWLRMDAFEPNVYLAVQPGAIPGERDESYLSVQEHPLQNKKIATLKNRLENGVSVGERFGDWTVSRVGRNDGCFTLVLMNGKEVRQEWCFGKLSAVVITESGPRRVANHVRNKVHLIVKEGAR